MTDDIVDRLPWPDCMMPDGGEACKYVAWQADKIERLKADKAELLAKIDELWEMQPND